MTIISLLHADNIFADTKRWSHFTTSKKPLFVEGEVLVKFKQKISGQAMQSSLSSLGKVTIKNISKRLGVMKVKLPPGQSVADAVKAYKAKSEVAHVQPNYIYRSTTLPNDDRFSQLWGIYNTGQTISEPSILSLLSPLYITNNPGAAGLDIDAQLAWDQITDCSSVIVAVLDTGINYTHEDLAANMWDGSGAGFPNHGYDFIDSDNDPMPTGGEEDHGTHVAGTIGAVGNNGLGITGVCWQAQIMSVRVLGANGSGSTAGIVQGIEFASDNGAKVINMSLGVEAAFDTLFSNAISYARDRDVVVVVAAGNDAVDNDNNDGLGGSDSNASTISMPCNFSQDNLICVAAIDQAYSIANFSNYGTTSVDVGAPGTNIISSYAGPVIRDDFTNGWNLSGSWTAITCNLASIPNSMLVNPPEWCSFGLYTNNIDDRAYKVINLSGLMASELSYGAFIETEPLNDLFYVSYDNNGGDPFDGINDTNLFTGSGLATELYNYNINGCITGNCSIGFRLRSDATTTSNGIGILSFEINTLKANSDSYENNLGTSMASPHVAGIVTMIRAFNPDYTYTHTIEALKQGGEAIAALSSYTASGKAANAMGSLAHITQPTGLSVNVQ